MIETPLPGQSAYLNGRNDRQHLQQVIERDAGVFLYIFQRAKVLRKVTELI
jgi:hypothetical protein